jgi:hypothetical protein
MMRFWLLYQPPEFAGSAKIKYARVVAENEDAARVFAADHFDRQLFGSGRAWLDPEKTFCSDDTRMFAFPTLDDPAIRTWEA